MNKQKRVLVCNAGTLHLFHLASELNRAGLLNHCATSLFFREKPVSLLPKIKKIVGNRMCKELEGKVITYAWPEIMHLLAARLGIKDRGQIIRWRNEKFQQWVVKTLLKDVDLVWSFDTCSEIIFTHAQKLGIPRVLDLSTIHPVTAEIILLKHARKYPEYAADIQGLEKSEIEIQSRNNEIRLATAVVGASEFSLNSIRDNEFHDKKLYKIPYGVDLSRFVPGKKDGYNNCRFLFAGWFSQGKGIYYLLRAWIEAGLDKTNNELWLAGGNRQDLGCWHDKIPENVRFLGRVPHNDLPEIYRQVDVFVFPSILEGFGLVILEAMASGLPVLTTTHTAGPDIIDEGKEGFISEPGDIKTLANQMKILSEDKTLRVNMGEMARNKSQYFTWQKYGNECANICLKLLGA